jgi:hypothetical protein
MYKEFVFGRINTFFIYFGTCEVMIDRKRVQVLSTPEDPCILAPPLLEQHGFKLDNSYAIILDDPLYGGDEADHYVKPGAPLSHRELLSVIRDMTAAGGHLFRR